jgi:hypothetical protein
MKNSDAGIASNRKRGKGFRFKKMKKRVLVNPLLSIPDAFVNGKYLYRPRKPFMSSPFATPKNYILVRW